MINKNKERLQIKKVQGRDQILFQEDIDEN